MGIFNFKIKFSFDNKICNVYYILTNINFWKFASKKNGMKLKCMCRWLSQFDPYFVLIFIGVSFNQSCLYARYFYFQNFETFKNNKFIISDGTEYNCRLYHLDHWTLPDGPSTFLQNDRPLIDNGGRIGTFYENRCGSKLFTNLYD